MPLGALGRATGTRFRLFPQAPYASAYAPPETVWVSPPAGTIGPGPSGGRMYVVDAVGKETHYGKMIGQGPAAEPYLPPWTGPVEPPAMPGTDGHFDHLEVGTPAFEAAHVYGTVRWVLDIWEDYFDHPIIWHFSPEFERLEISILRHLDNAHAGYGFLEIGYHHEDSGELKPFTLNFDVLAHETGHIIIYSVLGVPRPEAQQGEFYGFHESSADVVALISALHFDSVVDSLLANTSGNLYTLNKLNRIGELTDSDQIRLAAHNVRLRDFVDGWKKEHDLSRPLTGAIFDILVDIFHEHLVELGMISSKTEDLADQLEQQPEAEALIQDLFDRAYRANHQGFKAALTTTRDILGCYLAETWHRISADYLNYEDIADTMLQVDLEATGGRYQRLLERNFRLRDIGYATVGPRLAPPDKKSHAFSARTALPGQSAPMTSPRRLPYRTRMVLARGG